MGGPNRTRELNPTQLRPPAPKRGAFFYAYSVVQSLVMDVDATRALDYATDASTAKARQQFWQGKLEANGLAEFHVIRIVPVKHGGRRIFGYALFVIPKPRNGESTEVATKTVVTKNASESEEVKCLGGCGTVIMAGRAALGVKYAQGHRNGCPAPEAPPAVTAPPLALVSPVEGQVAEVARQDTTERLRPRHEHILAALRELHIVRHMTYEEDGRIHIRLECDAISPEGYDHLTAYLGHD